MSRHSLLARKRLLQRGQTVESGPKYRHQRRVLQYPTDVLAALQSMMFSAHRAPKLEKVIALAHHRVRSH